MSRQDMAGVRKNWNHSGEKRDKEIKKNEERKVTCFESFAKVYLQIESLYTSAWKYERCTESNVPPSQTYSKR